MSPSTFPDDSLIGVVKSARSYLGGPLEALAFWSAVFLPFCLLGLFASGFDGPTDYFVFTALVVANVAAVVIGHDYRQ
ncbi:hypothetical protein GJ631_11620 [Natronomonas sp. CBA1123]|jgi:hypothetical protein|uniref:hypothetical protein n=1 Tax=Natronomonas sp. CBA1123 TaxID=2668070 RepID=UPI0012EA9D77|nr:hypothetical protein [Natronomonas sp. CBA1123]MUV87194.1 hypothetical protein [Natronomonas sp. CBA1123]